MRESTLPRAVFGTLVPGLCAAILGALSGSLLLATSANAVTDTAYVAPRTGSDANTATNCGAVNPCQTLPAALSLSPFSVVIIEQGTFAPLTITTGLSITCPVGGCTFDGSAGGAVLTINAAGQSISLAGFLISSFGTAGTTGILVQNVGKLELKGMTISGSSIGIDFAPTAGNSHLYLLNSEIKNASTQNVLVQPTGSGSASAVFTGVRMHHGTSGFRADSTLTTGGVSVVIEGSVISFASNNGIAAITNTGSCPSGPFSRILMTRSTVSHTGIFGVNSNGCGAQILLDGNLITQNAQALATSNGGVINSMGNNAVFSNSSNGVVPTRPAGTPE